MVRILVLPIAREPLTPARWTAYRERFLERRIPEEYRRDVRSLLDEGLTADSFPAFTQMTSGGSGLLWVQEYDVPSAPRTWLVVDPHAQTSLSVQLPAGARVLDGTVDRVAVLLSDETGREEVRIYRLTPQSQPAGNQGSAIVIVSCRA